MTYYLRKAWVPIVQCPHNGIRPWQTEERNWAGSRLWMAGICIQCSMKELYGKHLDEHIMWLKTNPFLDFVGKEDHYEGGNFMIPLPFTVTYK